MEPTTVTARNLPDGSVSLRFGGYQAATSASRPRYDANDNELQEDSDSESIRTETVPVMDGEIVLWDPEDCKVFNFETQHHHKVPSKFKNSNWDVLERGSKFMVRYDGPVIDTRPVEPDNWGGFFEPDCQNEEEEDDFCGLLILRLEWYEKSHTANLEYLDLASKSSVTNQHLAHNISVIFDRISLSSRVNIKSQKQILERIQDLEKENRKLRLEVANLTKVVTENQPLTKSQVLEITTQISKQPKEIEERALKLTEDLSQKLARVETLINREPAEGFVNPGNLRGTASTQVANTKQLNTVIYLLINLQQRLESLEEKVEKLQGKLSEQKPAPSLSPDLVKRLESLTEVIRAPTARTETVTPQFEDQIRDYRRNQRRMHNAGRTMRQLSRRIHGRPVRQETLETAINPERELNLSLQRRASIVPAEVLYHSRSDDINHQVYIHRSEESILCLDNDQIDRVMIQEESYNRLQRAGLRFIHIGVMQVRIQILHRRDEGTMAMIVFRDNRWQGEQAILAQMEVSLADGGYQMIYVIPDIIMTIPDFYRNVQISIQTRGYHNWQGGEANLLVTRGLVGRLSNTSNVGFQYSINANDNYLVSRGVRAIPGRRFTEEELRGNNWIIRPSRASIPMEPTTVTARNLPDGSVSLRFGGYQAATSASRPRYDANDNELQEDSDSESIRTETVAVMDGEIVLWDPEDCKVFNFETQHHHKVPSQFKNSNWDVLERGSKFMVRYDGPVIDTRPVEPDNWGGFFEPDCQNEEEEDDFFGDNEEEEISLMIQSEDDADYEENMDWFESLYQGDETITVLEETSLEEESSGLARLPHSVVESGPSDEILVSKPTTVVPVEEEAEILVELGKDAQMPAKKTENAAGFDLYSAEDVYILPGEREKINTNVKMQIPEGYYGQIKDRSSMAMKKMTTCAGVIDADFRGEIQVVIHNFAKEIQLIKKGESCAQILFLRIKNFKMKEGILSKTARGKGGFGSTSETIAVLDEEPAVVNARLRELISRQETLLPNDGAQSSQSAVSQYRPPPDTMMGPPVYPPAQATVPPFPTYDMPSTSYKPNTRFKQANYYNMWNLPSAQTNSGAIFVIPQDLSKFDDVFLRWESITKNLVAMQGFTDAAEKAEFIENLLGEAEKLTWLQWRTRYENEYQQLLAAAEGRAGTQNILSQIRRIFTLIDPFTGSTVLQEEAYKDIQRLQCKDIKDILHYLHQYQYLAAKSGRMFFDTELSDKLFQKMPGDLGKRIEAEFLKQHPGAAIAVLPRILFSYRYLEEQCKEAAFQRSLKNLDFCKQMPIPGYYGDKKRFGARKSTTYKGKPHRSHVKIDKRKHLINKKCKCYLCGEEGHFARNCTNKRRNVERIAVYDGIDVPEDHELVSVDEDDSASDIYSLSESEEPTQLVMHLQPMAKADEVILMFSMAPKEESNFLIGKRGGWQPQIQLSRQEFECLHDWRTNQPIQPPQPYKCRCCGRETMQRFRIHCPKCLITCCGMCTTFYFNIEITPEVQPTQTYYATPKLMQEQQAYILWCQEEMEKLSRALKHKEEENEALMKRILELESLLKLKGKEKEEIPEENILFFNENEIESEEILSTSEKLLIFRVRIIIPGINPVDVNAVLDTGATTSSVDIDRFPKEAIEDSPYSIRINGVTSTDNEVVNKKLKYGKMQIGDQVFNIPFAYAFKINKNISGDIGMIIGCNFIRAMYGGIRIEGNEVTFYKYITKLHTINLFVPEKDYSREFINFLENEEICFGGIEKTKLHQKFASKIKQLSDMGYIGNEPLKYWKDNQVQCELIIKNPLLTIEDRPLKHVTPQMAESFDKQIKELLKIGVIRPSKSKHRTTAFMVQSGTSVDPKTGKETKGKERMVFNYQRLNDNTEKDQYPLPAQIEGGRIQLQEHIIKKLSKFGPAQYKEKKDLRSWLGLLNYARNYIPNLGKLLGPLYAKTSPQGEKRMNAQDWKIVYDIQSMVQKLPTLEVPEDNCYIVIESDGCMEGWGGICKWKTKEYDPPRTEKICAYASGTYNPLKSTIDAEIGAVIHSLESFKIFYLSQKKIIVRTDCQAIISFFNKSFSYKPSRLRWINFVDYITGTGVDYKFEHIAGKDNQLADTLSRLITTLCSSWTALDQATTELITKACQMEGNSETCRLLNSLTLMQQQAQNFASILVHQPASMNGIEGGLVFSGYSRQWINEWKKKCKHTSGIMMQNYSFLMNMLQETTSGSIRFMLYELIMKNSTISSSCLRKSTGMISESPSTTVPHY
ncbi:Zinc finger, CCHC-type [Dillenia turbinata]|uniref:Zinc finger, CCHC-type n=1 Tax=Dillenia turbinata TaxID=194707 RepID=A0AAN8VBK9_9MAGN